MEKIFVQRPQAEVSFLKKWIEKNGRMFEGTHSVTLVKTLTSQSGRIWWVVQDTVTGEIFRVLPGLFQELQEREADQEILVANESSEVTISEKIKLVVAVFGGGDWFFVSKIVRRVSDCMCDVLR